MNIVWQGRPSLLAHNHNDSHVPTMNIVWQGRPSLLAHNHNDSHVPTMNIVWQGRPSLLAHNHNDSHVPHELQEHYILDHRTTLHTHTTLWPCACGTQVYDFWFWVSIVGPITCMCLSRCSLSMVLH